MECYSWVDRQVGKRGRWQRLRLAELPYPPTVDDKVTMQRFASSTPQDGEPHKASFVLDFDAHAEWLDVEHCRLEALCFLRVFTACWGVAPHILTIAFSGRAGFHITIPSTLLGDVASPQLTLAYRAWASTIKDSLGLITLDAPSRHPPEWWYPQIAQVVGHLPPALQDRDTFALVLRRAGIYSRRRMIRRENSRHPGSDLYKIRLHFTELSQELPIIWALAKRPRALPVQLAPQPHPGLVAHLQGFLAEVTLQETHAAAAQKTNGDEPDDSGVAIPRDAQAPLCIQRLLEKQAPVGGSNQPLMTLAAYWRAKGIDVDIAIQLARQWLLHGVSDTAIRSDRADSARTVVQAAYKHRYQFARRFVAPLHLASDEECTACPLRKRCWDKQKGTA